MGFGSKIKSALSGDKDKDKHVTKRRPAPGAYPESTASIPRTNTTNTVRSRTGRPVHETKADEIQEEKEFDDYTHQPAGAVDPDAVSPLSDEEQENAGGYLGAQQERNGINGVVHGDKAPAKQQQQQQHPYWGDVGKPGTNGVATNAPNGTGFSDKDSGIAGKNSNEHQDVEGRASYDQYIHQPQPQKHFNGAGLAGSNTHPALREDEGHAGGFNLPTGSVNRGRPMLVDNEAAMASSMVASQVSGTTVPLNGMNYPQEQDRNMHTNTTAWVDEQPQYYTRQDDPATSYKPRGGAVDGMAMGHGYPEQQQQQQSQYQRQQQPAVNLADRTVSPINTNANNLPNGNSNSAGSTPIKSGAMSAGGHHYGPGHAGARVLHQCQHCGNDNDITRYFSKDVVYRLS
jgi:hypothetical protein